MLDGTMRVLECTRDTCVIHSGGSWMGLLAPLIVIPIMAFSLIRSRNSPMGGRAVAHGWGAVVGFFIPCILVPLVACGNAETVILSRVNHQFTVFSQHLFFFKTTRRIELGDVTAARNGGRGNQLQVSLADGGYLYVGYDTPEGGREGAADTINGWLAVYRGQGAQPATP